MILTLKNIGKIENATVELKGITVIAGENNTGKSTVGKVLFCIFNSFYKIQERIYRERRNNIGRILEMAYHDTTNRLTRRFDTEVIADGLLQHSDRYVENVEVLQQEILDSFIQFDENFKRDKAGEEFYEATSRIIEILLVPDETIFKTVLFKKLDAEFNGQINNIFFPEEEGTIELVIKDTNVVISLLDNQVLNVSNRFNLNTEAIYIDDPFALDQARVYPPYRYNNYANHREHLQSKLLNVKAHSSVNDTIGEIITTNKLDNILSKLNTICSGEMVKSRFMGFGYKKKNSDAVLDIKNISTGLKTFVIIKTLLLNGNLEENGTIILDEPEIHLHPEWQLLFAELIVLIQKEFGMHILLNTHSPYFLNAIEVYAEKYEILNKCKFYMTENVDTKSRIVDVTEDIDRIYEKLAQPLQYLENMRYSDD